MQIEKRVARRNNKYSRGNYKTQNVAFEGRLWRRAHADFQGEHCIHRSTPKVRIYKDSRLAR